MGVLMLSGEREVVRLRPTLLSAPGVHLAALALAGWALVLWALFASKGWQGEVIWWQPWTWFTGNDVAAHGWAAIAPVGAGLAAGLLAKNRLGLAVGIGAAVATSLLALVLGRPAPQALPVACALAALLVLLFAELRRRSRHLAATNLRLVAWSSLPRAEWAARHADLVDLELRQGPLGRLLDVGTLVAVEADGTRTRFTGVARAGRVHRLALALVRDATATAYLRSSQGLDRQVADALAALQRR